MKRRLRHAAPAALVAVGLLLSACTGVPSSSSPAVIQTIGEEQAQPQAVSTPPANADPRTIVTDFLQQNASADAHHLAARLYLTAEESNRWSDTTATVIADSSLQISNPDAQNRVTVTGQSIGTIDASGVYTPQQRQQTLTIGLRPVSGQGWRIDSLQNGLFITQSQFESYYSERVIYFFDQAEQHLVPDPRYTSLQDIGLLANWLMTQLAAGASADLQPATTTELPAQIDPRRVTATAGSVLKVEIPGSSQLGAQTTLRLGEQVALTLQSIVGSGPIAITDGGRAVRIPQFNSAVFTADMFPDAVSPAILTPRLYYVDQTGHVIDTSTGKPVPGPVGSSYYFTSIGLGSLSETVSDNHLLVAGTVLLNGQERLYVGTSVGPLHQVSGLRGRLSRPAWAPFRDEVWVASGQTLYWMTSAGKAQQVQITSGSGGASSGDILAVRLSPEGSRVALVIGNSSGGQLWIGSVVRTTKSVQVTGLKLISPAGTLVTDTAWNDSLKLFAIGRDAGGANVYEVQSDGSLWTPRGTSNLPRNPDSITVAENEVAAVSAQNTVWQQRGGSWVSLSGTGLTYGTNPVYVE